MNSVKRTLETHLLAGQIEPVIKSLTVLADQLGDNKLMNDAVAQYSRYQHLERDRKAGKLEEDALHARRQQIKQVLWLIIRRLPGQG